MINPNSANKPVSGAKQHIVTPLKAPAQNAQVTALNVNQFAKGISEKNEKYAAVEQALVQSQTLNKRKIEKETTSSKTWDKIGSQTPKITRT